MLNLALAKRYATALADLATEQKLLGAVADDLTRFAELLNVTPDLRFLLMSPTALAKDKHAALDVFIQQAKPTLIAANFLQLLVDKRRMDLVDAIIAAYHKVTEVRSGRITVDIQMPNALEKKTAEELKMALSKLTGKEVRLNSCIEPELLGGIVVRIGSLMMDYSVRNHLNRLKAQMRG